MVIMPAHCRDLKTVSLPPPQTEGKVSVEKALQLRRSVRSFTSTPLSIEDLGQLVWAAQGITKPKTGFRTAPSAGALYPLEIYLAAKNVNDLPIGIYRYEPERHRLVQIRDEEKNYATLIADSAFGQSWISDAAVTLVILGVYERTSKKYGRNSDKYVHIEAGHAAQNIYLQAESLGLGTTIVGAFNTQKLISLLKAGNNETPLAILPVGYPKE